MERWWFLKHICHHSRLTNNSESHPAQQTTFCLEIINHE